MAKGKDFLTNGAASAGSLQREAADIWGGIPTPESDDNAELRAAKKEKVELVRIFSIFPDPTQPRRALPSAIRAEWDGQPDRLPRLLLDWWEWAADQGWYPLFDAVLNGHEIERPDDVPTEFAALLEITTLAASIRRDGLMNPITLAKLPDNRYQIESGERRWLAYHLLESITGELQWAQIPARLVGEVNRWRQAAENNTRSDLNAIGKARQFAVLLMDLLAADGVRFAGFDQFENEQEYYAQVSDGDTYRIPRGKGELLLTAMGFKNTRQLRDYRALLRLPREIWLQADDENWTERSIRDLLQPTDTVPVGTVSDEPAQSPASGGKDHDRAGGKPKKLPRELNTAKTYTDYAISVLRSTPESELSKDQRAEIAERAKALMEYWAGIARRMDGD